MKCEICGKEVLTSGLTFDVRQDDRLLLCKDCYGHLFHLKYRAEEENVLSEAADYFAPITSQNTINEDNGGSFGMNGIFVPLTKEYIHAHPEHDLSSHTLYTLTKDSIHSTLDEMRIMQEKQMQQQEGLNGLLQSIKEHINILIGVSIISMIISFISLFINR